MKALRVFNNNVVLARHDDGREVIVTGRGLGFQAKPGSRLDATKIVRVFVPDEGRNVDNAGRFIAAIAPEHVALADEALAPLWAEQGCPPSTSTVVALADHLSYAIKRARQGLVLEYPLRAEIAHLYPRELAWGERIVRFVNERIEDPLPSEEAVAFAMHLVNASFTGGNLADTYRMTGVFSQIFEVIEGAFGAPIDRDSINAARFITHLRYFFVRVGAGEQLDDQGTPFVASIQRAYPDAERCARRVRDLLELRLGTPLTEGETAYLTLHIARLTQGAIGRTTP